MYLVQKNTEVRTYLVSYLSIHVSLQGCKVRIEDVVDGIGRWVEGLVVCFIYQ